jgi:epoxyqueuosine reductase
VAETNNAAAKLSQLAKAEAYALGFDLVGITDLGPMNTADRFDAWIAEGRHGAMDYLARGAEKRRDSRRPLPGTTHAIVVALDYGGKEPNGPVARYARGDDYHDVIEVKLRELHRRLTVHAGRDVFGKPYVDTGPLLERDLARRAGLGWFGKNTNLLNPTLGSFFFLGALVVDVELEVDAPFEADRCGTCTRCIDACRIPCEDRGADLRVRHLSGGLPMEWAVRAPQPRAGVCAACGVGVERCTDDRENVAGDVAA